MKGKVGLNEKKDDILNFPIFLMFLKHIFIVNFAFKFLKNSKILWK